MKCLIAICLGMSDPIANSVRMGIIDIGQCHIDIEALRFFERQIGRVEDDADCQDVVDFLKRHMLVLHLHPDGVRSLDALFDFVLDVHGIQTSSDRCCESIKYGLTCGFCICQFEYDILIFCWVLKTETEVFELRLNLVEPQTMCQRSIDVKRLACNLILLVLALRTQGTHIVQAVGYLDENHTNILTHREQELLEILSLGRCVIAKDTSRNLGQSINNLRYLWTKNIGNVLHRVVSILNHIMKQCRADGCTTQTYIFTHNLRHCQRVHDIRFSRQTTHSLMGMLRKVESLGDDFNFLTMRRCQI